MVTTTHNRFVTTDHAEAVREIERLETALAAERMLYAELSKKLERICEENAALNIDVRDLSSQLQERTFQVEQHRVDAGHWKEVQQQHDWLAELIADQVHVIASTQDHSWGSAVATEVIHDLNTDLATISGPDKDIPISLEVMLSDDSGTEYVAKATLLSFEHGQCTYQVEI